MKIENKISSGASSEHFVVTYKLLFNQRELYQVGKKACKITPKEDKMNVKFVIKHISYQVYNNIYVKWALNAYPLPNE